jgi:photosystem II stability/assembly factor-like uncharacterized protein
MKKRFTFYLLLASAFVHAQNSAQRNTENSQQNFSAIKAAAEKRFANEVVRESKASEPFEKDNDYFKFKRWDYYWKDRVMPDGTFPDLNQQATIFNNLKGNSLAKSVSSTSNWVNISQTSATGGYNGMGRLTSIAFHPTDPNIFWVGAPMGGIWKTIDGGQSYSSLGDNLPLCSVGNIVVDYTNPNIIYITIGDHIGWWNYGLGVYKTIDGGLTWTPTTLVSPYTSNIAYYAMAISPSNPNVIFVAKTDGLYRTNNGGSTWTLARSGGHRDVKFRPNDSSTVYASSDDYWGASEVYKSSNGGLSFTKISNFNAAQNTIRLAVTPANNNVLGILVTSGTTKKYYNSTNSGAAISLKSNLPEDAIIFISPSNTNKVYTGSLDVHASSDAGLTWVKSTNWYNNGIQPEVHADQHFVASNPLNNMIYFCNDGGLYRFDESTSTWTELNNGLVITQFYTIAVSQTDPVFMIGGTQDNGGRKRTGINTWAETNGGDAMETAIDPTNSQTIYSTYTYGQLYRSYDQWTNDVYYGISPNGVTGSWVTPYVLDPNNPLTLVAGYEDVYKSIDQGDNWTKISNNLTGGVNNKLEELAVAPSNSNVIYTGRGIKFYATSNGGTNWSTYTLPFTNVNFSTITSITVNPTVSSTVYVTVGGYNSGKKIYKSINSGATWTNISGTLPNVPVSTCIIDKNSSTNEIYIGTDVGVFYINDVISTWTYFGTNLPNTAVSDLEIQYSSGKLRAGTFGRGIWEIDLISNASSLNKSANLKNGNRFSSAYNPVKDVLYMNANIIKDVDAKLHFYNEKGELSLSILKHFQQGNYQIPIDISRLAAGVYFVKIASDNEASEFKMIKE